MNEIEMEKISQLERQEMLFWLLDRAVGPLPLPSQPGYALLPVGREALVFPRISVPFSAPIYAPWTPHRLVIFEPVIELIEEEHVVEWAEFRVAKCKKNWLGMTVTVEEPERQVAIQQRIEHKHHYKVERNCWYVDAIYVGQKVQFASQGAICGDAFGLTGEALAFDDPAPVMPGICITMQVRHTLAQPVPFRAAILGKMVTP